MNRRKFLTLFKGAPLMAAPTVAIGALAIAGSAKANEKLKDINLQGDNVVINNSTFTMTGSLTMKGTNASLTNCMITAETRAGENAIDIQPEVSYKLNI